MGRPRKYPLPAADADAEAADDSPVVDETPDEPATPEAPPEPAPPHETVYMVMKGMLGKHWTQGDRITEREMNAKLEADWTRTHQHFDRPVDKGVYAPIDIDRLVNLGILSVVG